MLCKQKNDLIEIFLYKVIFVFWKVFEDNEVSLKTRMLRGKVNYSVLLSQMHIPNPPKLRVYRHTRINKISFLSLKILIFQGFSAFCVKKDLIGRFALQGQFIFVSASERG